MASVFSMIINGDIPGRFVWKDGEAVAFLTIEPVTPPATSWWCPPATRSTTGNRSTARCSPISAGVAQKVGQAVKNAFDAPRIGLLIAGLEVPHVHIHVFQGLSLETFDLANANKNASPRGPRRRSREDPREPALAGLRRVRRRLTLRYAPSARSGGATQGARHKVLCCAETVRRRRGG